MHLAISDFEDRGMDVFNLLVSSGTDLNAVDNGL